MIVRPTVPHDLNAFERIAEQIGELHLDESSFPTERSRAELAENWRTFLIEEPRPLCVVGLMPMWPGVATIVGVFSTECAGNGRELSLALLDVGSTMLPDRGIRRLECSVRKDWASARKWLKRFGFIQEGPLRAYGMHGEDYIRMARFQ